MKIIKKIFLSVLLANSLVAQEAKSLPELANGIISDLVEVVFSPFSTVDSLKSLITKLISITLAPLLYIIAGTLVVRIPHLLEGLTATKGVVSVIYGITAFILFDGGLYFLFGVSFIVLLAKRIYKNSSQSHSQDL